MRDVAEKVGSTERAAQRIVADLIEGGYLESTRQGRRNVYGVNGSLPLRHPIEEQNPSGGAIGADPSEVPPQVPPQAPQRNQVAMAAIEKGKSREVSWDVCGQVG